MNVSVVLIHSAQTDWNASLRARVVLALDKTLVYIPASPSITASKVELQCFGCKAAFKKCNVFGAATASGVEHALSDKLIALLQLEHVATGKSGTVVTEGSCRGAFTRSTTAISASLAYKF
jgi:hypothetical protein